MSEERDIMQEILDDNGLGSIAFQGPRTPVGPFSDEWPHNRSREAWDRARAERWPDPSWSSLRKVERWEEMRREGLMQWEGYEPAFFRLRTTDGWMTRHNWEWDELKERRALFYATQESARPGQYLPTRGPAGVRARARACGLESDVNTLLCYRARHERAVDEGRMSHAEVPVWRIAGDQVYFGGGLVGWFRHLDPLVARHTEDPTPTAETPPLYEFRKGDKVKVRDGFIPYQRSLDGIVNAPWVFARDFTIAKDAEVVEVRDRTDFRELEVKVRYVGRGGTVKHLMDPACLMLADPDEHRARLEGE